MSYEEAGVEDRLIIEMREKDGKQWLDIKAAIEEITGTKFGNTTLKGRYARMKSNFVVFEKEHVCCVSLAWYNTADNMSYSYRSRFSWMSRKISRKSLRSRNGRRLPPVLKRDVDRSIRLPPSRKSTNN